MSYFEDLSAEEKEALKEEFEREDTTRERRVELLTLLQEAADEAKQLPPCPRCKHHLFYAPHHEALIEGHVYSRDGMAEISITGYCEFCFDLITKEPDEDAAEDEEILAAAASFDEPSDEPSPYHPRNRARIQDLDL